MLIALLPVLYFVLVLLLLHSTLLSESVLNLLFSGCHAIPILHMWVSQKLYHHSLLLRRDRLVYQFTTNFLLIEYQFTTDLLLIQYSSSHLGQGLHSLQGSMPSARFTPKVMFSFGCISALNPEGHVTLAHAILSCREFTEHCKSTMSPQQPL